MKKRAEINAPSNKNILENKNQNDFKSKTTNVNILLNRVRVEKKNNLKKKNNFHINHNHSSWVNHDYCSSLI